MSEEVKEPKAKPPKMTAIKVIETRGESSLVEWAEKGIARRGYVQNDSLDGNKALPDVLDYALPVGPDPMLIDLSKFTERLRKRNVWTKADFLQKRNSVIKSMLEAMEV